LGLGQQRASSQGDPQWGTFEHRREDLLDEQAAQTVGRQRKKARSCIERERLLCLSRATRQGRLRHRMACTWRMQSGKSSNVRGKSTFPEGAGRQMQSDKGVAESLRTLPDFASSARYCAHMAGTTRPRLGEYKIKSPPSLPAPCAPTSSFVAHAEQLNALLEWALCHDTARSSSLRPSADKDRERMDGLDPATKASASCADSYKQSTMLSNARARLAGCISARHLPTSPSMTAPWLGYGEESGLCGRSSCRSLLTACESCGPPR
jgi:hypothetical protein